MIYVLAIIAIAVVGFITIAGTANIARVALDTNKKRLVASEAALRSAEKSLRSIANDPYSASLEAQIALDEISVYHTKELT